MRYVGVGRSAFFPSRIARNVKRISRNSSNTLGLAVIVFGAFFI
jgi:hypothetical protein